MFQGMHRMPWYAYVLHFVLTTGVVVAIGFALNYAIAMSPYWVIGMIAAAVVGYLIGSFAMERSMLNLFARLCGVSRKDLVKEMRRRVPKEWWE